MSLVDLGLLGTVLGELDEHRICEGCAFEDELLDVGSVVADFGEQVSGDGFVVLEIEAFEVLVEHVDEALWSEDFVVDFLGELGLQPGVWLLRSGTPRAASGA